VTEKACSEAVAKYAELSGEKPGDVLKLINALPAKEGQTAAEYQAKVLPYLQTYKEGVDKYLEKKETDLQTKFDKKVEAFEKEKQTARDTMAAAIERIGQPDYQTVKKQLSWWLSATPEQLEEKAADRRRKLHDSQELENGRQRLSNASGPKR
jgi:transketolase